MKADRAKGTLVVPMWKSAPFWPMLKGKSFVKQEYILNPNSVVKGRGNNGIFSFPMNFDMIAFRIVFD